MLAAIAAIDCIAAIARLYNLIFLSNDLTSSWSICIFKGTSAKSVYKLPCLLICLCFCAILLIMMKLIPDHKIPIAQLKTKLPVFFTRQFVSILIIAAGELFSLVLT